MAGLAHIHENTMLKRITAIFVVMSLLLPSLNVPASSSSVLWVSTSDHTDLVKDEEYESAPVLMLAVPGVDDDASPLVEETDGGLEILYEEPGPPEPIIVERESALPEPISVEDEVKLDLMGYGALGYHALQGTLFNGRVDW